MAFVFEMGILDAVLGAVEHVDFLNIGKPDLRNPLGPVFAVGDNELRAGSGEGGDFRVVGFVGGALMDRHAAFAGAAAKEKRGHLADGDTHRDAVIDGGEHKRLGASTRTAGDGDALIIHAREGLEEVDGSNAVPCLEPENCGSLLVGPPGHLRVTIAYHVELEDGCARTGHDGAAGLTAGNEPSAMPLGAEDAGQLAFMVGW